MDLDRKRTEKFLEFMKDFQFTDVLAFGKLLSVEEKEDFEEFVVDILEAFNLQNRNKRREMLKLAKDVSRANKDLGFKKENVKEN